MNCTVHELNDKNNIHKTQQTYIYKQKKKEYDDKENKLQQYVQVSVRY